jgi:hypothetical protein
MAQRRIHYEAAFEDYVRSLGWPYVPVNEHKKAVFSGVRVKSCDFVVHRTGAGSWLVDVKGRKFPYTLAGGRRYWENWVMRTDLDDLERWRLVFGTGFEPMLVFAYWLIGAPKHEPSSSIHCFRNEFYAFLAVSASEYALHARTRSASWDTLSVPGPVFRRLVRPLGLAPVEAHASSSPLYAASSRAIMPNQSGNSPYFAAVSR